MILLSKIINKAQMSVTKNMSYSDEELTYLLDTAVKELYDVFNIKYCSERIETIQESNTYSVRDALLLRIDKILDSNNTILERNKDYISVGYRTFKVKSISNFYTVIYKQTHPTLEYVDKGNVPIDLPEAFTQAILLHVAYQINTSIITDNGIISDLHYQRYYKEVEALTRRGYKNRIEDYEKAIIYGGFM